jgi:peptidoglycan hydrolase FlgJ
MIGGVEGLYHLKGTNPAKALDKACKEFESLFAYQLMKVMGESVPSDGLFDGNFASDTYRDMLFQNVGQAVAETGALGIGSMLKTHEKALVAFQANSGGTVQSR